MAVSRNLLTLAACTSLLVGIGAPVHAVDEPNPLDVIQSVAPEVLAAAADDPSAPAGGDDAVVVDAGDATAMLPDDPTDGVTLGADDGDTMSIGLPNASEADAAEAEAAGVVSYDNGDGSTTVPVVRDDASVQILTVIDGPEAPREYVYPLELPDGAALHLDEASGFVSILSSDGEFLGGVAPAWAKDAMGADVATHYEVVGTTLTQVVEHSAGVAYPVVADPWLGMALVQRVVWTSSMKTLQVYSTDFARVATNLARWAGWAEVQIKTPGTRENTTSMQDQYLCHFDAVRLRKPDKPSWNLDLGRPNVSWAKMLLSSCNP